MDKRTCLNCQYMKAKIPIKKNRILYSMAHAQCCNENGLLSENRFAYTERKMYNIGKFPVNYEFTDWKVFGNLCKSFELIDQLWI